MTVHKTHISWTNSSWNPTNGCTKVSAGCDFCYAEGITHRMFGHPFEEIKLHHHRIGHVSRFKPLADKDGFYKPHLVFVNSMSDLHHEQIPDEFRDKVYDAMETNDGAVFQILTKRPGPMGRYLKRRYGSGRTPFNFWFGVSIEDNRVAKRIDVLREIKARHSIACAFLSVEPLIGPIDGCDFTSCDWILIGGESGPRCRDMKLEWLVSALDKSREVSAAIWFKQYGHARNNPHVMQFVGGKIGLKEAFRIAVERGIEREPDEKGGATLNGEIYHELPIAWHEHKTRLSLLGPAPKSARSVSNNKISGSPELL